MGNGTHKEAPRIKVKLTGTSGNAYAVLGRCREAAMKGHMDPAKLAEFTTEATSGDYDHLLGTAMRWFDVV